MTFYSWHLGFTNNFAIGIIWHSNGRWMFMFLGLTLFRLERLPE
jgi:hypothetical protein